MEVQVKQHPQASRSQRANLMRYAVVIEKAGDNYSGYVPDLPGCIATGATVRAVEIELKEAIRFHIEGLVEDGLPVPEPVAVAEYVDA
jgi:predicted RNase H-like HicB family nuclease